MVLDIETRDAVLDAYRQARAAGKEAADCYQAAVEAWRALHPEHDRAQVAKQAVKIVFDTFGTLQEIARDQIGPAQFRRPLSPPSLLQAIFTR
jgi:ferric-dicitrate binding protein FerR (iron transport regulator)